MPAPNKPAIAKRPLKLAPVKFDEAILATRARGVVLPDVYYGHMQGIARADSFSVAGIARVEQLRQVLDSLTQAQAKGETFDAWKARVRRGEVDLDLPDHRLDNIYRTNIQGAYARGRCRQHDVIAARRPWLLYSAVNDSRTRPAHAAMNGTLLHRDDPWWATHRPPNGYRCRCTVIAVSNAEAERRGAPKAPKVDESTGGPPDPDEGWDYDVCSDPRAGTKRATRRAKANASPKVAERLDRIETTADSNDPATWRGIPDTQKGSNPGGIYEAPDGSKHYVKFYEDPNQARTEVASARLNERMGVQTLKPRFVEVDGKSGVATNWVDGLTKVTPADLATSHIDDLAAAFNAAVVTKNWDVIGQQFDNLVLHPNGRLVLVDTGGSFKYRAQGKAKPFGVDIDEAKSLADPAQNASASLAFVALKRDVFSVELSAKKNLTTLTRSEIEDLMTLSGFEAKTAKSLAATVDGRRQLLLDRYNLGPEDRLTPGARKHYDKIVEKFDRTAFVTVKDDRATSGVVAPGIKDVMEGQVMIDFENYLRREFDAKAGPVLRSAFASWSSSSSQGAGAVMKLWANKNFDVDITFHDLPNPSLDVITAEAKAFAGATGIDRLMDLLDLEQAFTTYTFRRLTGYDPVVVQRGMAEAEYRNQLAEGTYRANAVSSVTASKGAWMAERRVEITAPAERFVKSWYQGARYLRFKDTEAEYVLIGGKYSDVKTVSRGRR
jgi:SPP1 gp7 family putative phage head morphogenesis protein